METPDRLLAINEALGNLERKHPDVARLLKLRYFAGVPLKDAAAAGHIARNGRAPLGICASFSLR